MDLQPLMHLHCLFVGEFLFVFDSRNHLFLCQDLINMILLSYPTDPKSSATFYSGQRAFQTFLILIAVLCIPWMLLGKPVYRIVMNKRRANVSIPKSPSFFPSPNISILQ